MSPSLSAMVACGYCGQRFREDRGQPVCRRCPLASGCHFVRCPRCGYENPVPPRWLSRFIEARSGDDPD